MQQRIVRRRFALLFLLALAAAGCDDDNDPISTQPPSNAQLRVVNAANIPDVQVRRTGTTTPLAQDLDFRGSTATCVTVPAGEQTLVFSSAGVDLTTTAFTFEGNKKYTAFLVALSATRRAVVLPDNQTADPNNNLVRFINATSAPGDVYLTPPGAAPALSFRVVGNMGVLATSNDQPQYYSRATTDTRARLYDVGTTATPRADLPLAGIPPTRLVTVVFTDAASAGDPTAFIVTPCP